MERFKKNFNVFFIIFIALICFAKVLTSQVLYVVFEPLNPIVWHICVAIFFIACSIFSIKTASKQTKISNIFGTFLPLSFIALLFAKQIIHLPFSRATGYPINILTRILFILLFIISLIVCYANTKQHFVKLWSIVSTILVVLVLCFEIFLTYINFYFHDFGTAGYEITDKTYSSNQTYSVNIYGNNFIISSSNDMPTITVNKIRKERKLFVGIGYIYTTDYSKISVIAPQSWPSALNISTVEWLDNETFLLFEENKYNAKQELNQNPLRICDMY